MGNGVRGGKVNTRVMANSGNYQGEPQRPDSLQEAIQKTIV